MTDCLASRNNPHCTSVPDCGKSNDFIGSLAIVRINLKGDDLGQGEKAVRGKQKKGSGQIFKKSPKRF